MSENRGIIEAFAGLAPRYESVVDGELRRFWGWSYQGFIERITDALPLRDGHLVLDVATGTALIPRTLVAKAPDGARIIGLDITLPMLQRGQQMLAGRGEFASIHLVCASALAMPFAEGTFDVVICALATHHMDVPHLLSEMRRVLKPGGRLAIADVAASPVWKWPGVKLMLRVATLLYFLPGRNIARAWAESEAVSHVHTQREWASLLNAFGFQDIEVEPLRRRHFYVPAPLFMRAIKR